MWGDATTEERVSQPERGRLPTKKAIPTQAAKSRTLAVEGATKACVLPIEWLSMEIMRGAFMFISYRITGDPSK